MRTSLVFGPNDSGLREAVDAEADLDLKKDMAVGGVSKKEKERKDD